VNLVIVYLLCSTNSSA